MKRKRRVFDQAFKIAAVKLILEDEIPVSEVSRQIEVHSNSLYRWVAEYEEHGENAFPGRGTPLFQTQLKMKRLQRENDSLREELELLKKFRAFLKKDPS